MKYQGTRLRELLAGEYVLGVLTGAARRRFERLMMDDGGIRAEVLDWEQRFAAWTLRLEPVEPPRRLWWRVMAAVRKDARSGGAEFRNTFWRAWAVAATVVIAIMAVSQYALPPAERKPAAVAMVADAAGHTWWMISVHPEMKRIDMKAVMPNPPPAGKSYELWMLHDSGNPEPMGLLNIDGTVSEQVSAELLARLDSVKTLAVSLEPAGGSPTGLPTGPVLYTASLVHT